MNFWKVLVRMWDPAVIVILTLQGMIITFVAYFLQQFEPKQKWDSFQISVNGVRCYFGLPCSYLPENNANRVLYISVLYGCIIFTTVLSTMIIKFFTTTVYDPQIRSIDEIIDGDFNLVGNQYILDEISRENRVNVTE